MERIKALAETVTRNVEAGANEMRAAYGEQHAEKVWACEYYRHKQHKYLVPAMVATCSDEQQAQLPTLAAKNAAFYAAALRSLPNESIAQYCSALTIVPGMDLALLMATVHGMGTPVGRAVFDRLAVSVRRAGNKDLLAAVQHIGSVSVVPTTQWAFPHLAADLDENTPATWKPDANASPRPYELTALSAPARDMLDGPEWLLVAATTVLECQWAEFYATGSKAPLQRVLEASVPWAEFVAMPDAVSYLIAVEKPLPDELAFKPGMPGPAALRSIRATIARAAVWSLLHHTRRHPVVVEAIAEAVAGLAQYVAEPSARTLPEDAPQLTEEEARARLEVWPALLHLVARGRLDAPFAEDLEASVAKSQ